MKKCRLAQSTRQKWIKIINKSLRQKGYGSTGNCELCKEVFGSENEKSRTRWETNIQCIKKCIMYKYIKAKGIEYSYRKPFEPCIVLRISMSIGFHELEKVRKELRAIRSWLK